MSLSGSTQKTKAERPSQQATARGAPRQAATSGAAAAGARAAHGSEGLVGRFNEWVRVEGAWWAASFVFHTLLMAALMLVPHTVSTPVEGETTTIEEAETDAVTQQPQLERFEVGQPTEMPAELSTETLSLTKAPEMQSASVDVTGQGVSIGNFAGAGGAGPTVGGLTGGFSIVGIGPGAARGSRSTAGMGIAGGGSGVGGTGGGFGIQDARPAIELVYNLRYSREAPSNGFAHPLLHRVAAE